MQAKIHILTYGTLMFPQVINSLVTEKYQSKKATLKGYRRHALRHKTYPAVVKEQGAIVHGILYFNINSTDVKTLDKFQWEYDRTPVTVTLQNGDAVSCYVYIFRDRNQLLPEDWDPKTFQKHHCEFFAGQHSSSIPN